QTLWRRPPRAPLQVARRRRCRALRPRTRRRRARATELGRSRRQHRSGRQRRSRTPCDRKRGKTACDKDWLARPEGRARPQRRKPLEEGRQCDGKLEPREWRPDTEMDSLAEREMPRQVVALGRKARRITKGAFIAVRRGEMHHHARAGWDTHPT